MLPDVIADGEAERHLTSELVALDEARVLFSCELLFELEIVVPETNGAHPKHRHHCEQHIAVVELCPQERADESRAKDDEAAHRGRSSFLLVHIRRSFPNHLMQTHSAQATHDAWADNESEKERSDCCAGRAERNPLEQPQK